MSDLVFKMAKNIKEQLDIKLEECLKEYFGCANVDINSNDLDLKRYYDDPMSEVFKHNGMTILRVVKSRDCDLNTQYKIYEIWKN